MGLDQPLLRELPLGDILPLDDGRDDGPVLLRPDVRRVPEDCPDSASPALDGDLHRLPPLPLQGIGHLSQGLLPPLLGEEDLGIFADHLLGGVPRQPLEGPVDADELHVRPPDGYGGVGVVEEALQVFARLLEGHLRPLPAGDVSDRLDGPGDLPIVVVEGRRDRPDVGPPPAVEVGRVDLGEDRLPPPAEEVVVAVDLRILGEDRVYQDRPLKPEEGLPVGVISFSHDLVLGDAGHLFDRPVPGDDGLPLVDDEGGVGEKVYYLLELVMGPTELLVHPVLLCDLGEYRRKPSSPDREGGYAEVPPRLWEVTFELGGGAGLVHLRVNIQERRPVGPEDLRGPPPHRFFGLHPGDLLDLGVCVPYDVVDGPALRIADHLVEDEPLVHVLEEGPIPLLALDDGPFCPQPLRSLPDLVGQLRVEDPRVCVLLEVVVGAVVQGLYHHLLPPLPGEEDEGDLRLQASDPLQKRYAVHLRHHVIGDDDVVAVVLQPLHRLHRRPDGFHLYVTTPPEEYLRDIQDCGIVVDDENSDHRISPACHGCQGGGPIGGYAMSWI
ncbi:MAG: hypothetical protein A4E51_00933 [Methanosaeta sp. PtaU1.Bin055]|nr:MAG: hypothetical protein A4E51_00933 [Methanosaeta sp. PtaU1.Bin055]